MAALIPAIGTCVSRMTGGERRLAYRLEQKLEDDWLLWYDVPLGPRNVHPDFVVFNPRRSVASELLKPSVSDEDGVPLVAPVSAGRHSPKPLLIKLPSIQEEADYIAKRLKEAHKTGTPWSDMAVIYRDYGIGKQVLATLRKAGIPVTYQDDITFAEKEDTVKFLTIHICKGLEFPLVAIPGAWQAVNEGWKDDESRLLYVAMTRATRGLVVVDC